MILIYLHNLSEIKEWINHYTPEWFEGFSIITVKPVYNDHLWNTSLVSGTHLGGQGPPR